MGGDADCVALVVEEGEVFPCVADVEADAAALEANIEAAAVLCAFVREAPLTPPAGEVEAFWKPDRARKTERKLEKKGRFVLIVTLWICAMESCDYFAEIVRRPQWFIDMLNVPWSRGWLMATANDRRRDGALHLYRRTASVCTRLG